MDYTWTFLILLFPQWLESTIFIHRTEDGDEVEFYDCLYMNDYLFCRRPNESITLNRKINREASCHNGTLHSFHSMKLNNIATFDVLHHWRSSLEMVEKYSEFLQGSMRNDDSYNGFICQCNDSSTFGKNCEYSLASAKSFEQALYMQSLIRRNNKNAAKEFNDILCYETLKCDSGLLCLDWRDICDGVQQCMFGDDEENCDLLEFNECESNEYRCMNGMCIPDKYFLNGDFDCMDLSDEKDSLNDFGCSYYINSAHCDDRFCLPNEWSCGDGQCIKNRTSFQDQDPSTTECENRRDQFFMCELHGGEKLWTKSDGRCTDQLPSYSREYLSHLTSYELCILKLKCRLSQMMILYSICTDLETYFASSCNMTFVQYPQGNIIAPYLSFYHNINYALYITTPSMIKINGSIKCRGYLVTYYAERTYLKNFDLKTLESILCADNESVIERKSGGYDQNCNQYTTTFNNRSYFFLDICSQSHECFSAYRIHDGLANCADQKDENAREWVGWVCNRNIHYRFNCGNQQPTCLSVVTLGDTFFHCQNRYDESLMGFAGSISKMQCNSQVKDECSTVRQYIESSWSTELQSIYQINSTKRIPFLAYCDTFWDYSSKKDEYTPSCSTSWTCLRHQWRCRTGQCIDPRWVLDGEWDCADASDEEAVFYLDNHLCQRNLQLLKEEEIENRFRILYSSRPLTSICNPKTEYPCYHVNGSDPLGYVGEYRPCISVSKLGNNVIDCLGAIDEQNTVEYCNRATMLGSNFKCITSDECFPYSKLCQKRCQHERDDDVICYGQGRAPDCNDKQRDFMCYNQTCATGGWCDLQNQCQHGEDEYLCNKLTGVGVSYLSSYHRRDKEHGIVYNERHLSLPRFPPAITPSRSQSELSTLHSNQQKTSRIAVEDLEKRKAVFLCNRGLAVYMENNSVVCFCPQPYYGDRCEYYSDRLTIVFQLNYTKPLTSTILLKMLVLLLYNDEIIDAYEAHDRLIGNVPNVVTSKKVDHFVYSRSKRFLSLKRQRYLNRSNILENTPYMVRIEAYELKISVPPKIVAVWQFPIYFDFLPAFRLVKMLPFYDMNEWNNPCSTKPCPTPKVCSPLLNEPGKYVCLCPDNYSGENCSLLDQKCVEGYCGPNSLCKSNYHGLLNRNDYPYCICPHGFFGRRCYLEHEQCRSNPCQNGGTCAPSSTPNHYFCTCQSINYGPYCQYESVKITWLIKTSVSYRASVIQYFSINFDELNLVLVHQHVFHVLPEQLSFFNSRDRPLHVALIKFYSETLTSIYLLALHMNIGTTTREVVINETNYCVPVRLLIAPDQEITPFEYHKLCQNNQSLICFYDHQYMCFCDSYHTRTNCFGYDHTLDQCSRCLSGGRCIKGNPDKPDDQICLCPTCYSGRFCEFSSLSFAFTLDQLFTADLLSNNLVVQNVSFSFIIFISWILFLVGLLNNLCSFITLKRPRCQESGAGIYLLVISVVNQLSLTLLAARLTHMAVNITSYRLFPKMDTLFCAIFSYLSLSSNRIVYWLLTLVSIERAFTTLTINGNWFKKPFIGKLLSICTISTILIIGAYECVFLKSYPEINKAKGSACIIEFPAHNSFWFMFHRIVMVMQTTIPFIVNLICVIIIIWVVVQKKMNLNHSGNLSVIHSIGSVTQAADCIDRVRIEKSTRCVSRGVDLSRQSNLSTRLQLFLEVIRENKELVIGPIFTLVPQLFSLPIFFASVLLSCQTIETSPIRYLYIMSTCALFIPHVLSFFLYIYPSTFYLRQWHATKLWKFLVLMHVQRSFNNAGNYFPTQSKTVRTEKMAPN